MPTEMTPERLEEIERKWNLADEWWTPWDVFHDVPYLIAALREAREREMAMIKRIEGVLGDG